MQVSDFIGAFKQGGARTTLFRIEVANPVDSTADSQLPLMGHAAAVPASSVNVLSLDYMGRRVNFAGHRQFGAWGSTIYCDEDFKIRNALESWNNKINTYQGNIRDFGTSSPLEYKSTGKMYLLSKTNQVLRVYQFFGLWPSEVSDIRYGWGQDAIAEFDVTWTYDYFEITDGITGNAGGA